MLFLDVFCFLGFARIDLRRRFSLSILAAGEGALGSPITSVLLFFGTGWFLFEFKSDYR